MIEYREAQSCEYEEIRRFVALMGWEKRVADPSRFQRMIAGAFRHLVAIEDGRIVGFVRAVGDGVSNGYISMLAVDAERRRRGIGRELVTRILGDDPDITWVIRAGRGSAAFWTRMGFVSSPIAMERCRRVD